MPRNESRAGKRVDQIRVTDEKHEMYREDGTPVLLSTRIGKVVEKEVESYTVTCPDCSTFAKFDHASEPVCPDCGTICDGRQGKEISQSERLVIDAKAAGRVQKKSAEP